METKVITPSKPDLWRGTNNGSSMTVEQLNAIAKPNRQRDRAWQSGKVPREYLVVLLTEPKTIQDIPRQVRFPCPALAVSRDLKRILVITPSGLEAWVDLK